MLPAKRSNPIRSLSVIVAFATWTGIFLILSFCDYPPLIDWPNHMARHYLESEWVRGQVLPAYYDIHYSIIPNLGSDLIVPFLILAFGVNAASKIFLIFSVFIYFLGPTLFILQHNKRSEAAFAAAALGLPWLMAGTFLWGFLNFYLGVGAAFLAVWNHIRLLQSSRVESWQLIVHSALVTLLYFCHLTSFGIYLIVAGLYTLQCLAQAGDQWKVALHRLVLIALTIMPAVIILTRVMLVPKINALSGGVVWSTALRKFVLIGGYFISYTPWLDITVLLVWVLALLLTFSFSKISWRNVRPKDLSYLHFAWGFFAILYLALPVEIGTTSGADIRMLPPLLICSLAIVGSLSLARFANVGMALVLLCSIAKNLSIFDSWIGMSNTAREVALFAQKSSNPASPRRVLVLLVDRATKSSFESHLMDWAVPESGMFVSDLFSFAGQQPLELKGPKPANYLVKGPDMVQINSEAVHSNYDYVWLFNPKRTAVGIPSQWKYVLGDEDGKLWKVE